MLRFFPIVMILQGYCLYHAYSNKAEQRWYWLIFFLPVIGSIYYLYYHFYNRKNIKNIAEGIKGAVNTNYQVEKLEREVKFLNSVENKTLLADEYMNLGRYDEAIELYSSCLEGFNKNDPGTMMNLIKAYYLKEDYKSVVDFGEGVVEYKDFKQSEGRICYAWSLFHTGHTKAASSNFKEMDFRFSNYPHRLEYCRLLNKLGKKKQAIEKLERMLDEISSMSTFEKRNKKVVSDQINVLLNHIKEK